MQLFFFGVSINALTAIQSLGERFLHPVSIVSMNAPDQALIYTNRQFQNLVQYKEEDILGKNCRFLQGDKTDRDAVTRIRNAISNRLPICQDLLNYKSNGEIFYNRLVLIPFKDGKEDLFLGLQHELDIKKFKPYHSLLANELLDKTINPISILLFLLKNPDADFDKDLLSTMERIKSFITEL